MNGSQKQMPQLQHLLDRVRATGAEQQELMMVLLEATWWVKDELQRQSDIFKKHEERLQALEATSAAPPVAALEAAPEAAPAPRPSADPAPKGVTEVKPQPASSAPAVGAAPAATAADSDLLELGLDLFADLKKQAPAPEASAAVPNLVEEIKAVPADPLMESDPWRGRNQLDMDGKAAPIGATKSVNKAAVGARPQDDTAAPAPSRPTPKAMPVEIAQRRAAKGPRAELPSQSLRENLDKVARSQSLKEKLLAKVVEKESRQETVAALAAKAQTLMGDEGPPPPPSKAAPEGKSPEAKTSPVTATVAKAAGTKPPAKAPPVALVKLKAESGDT